VDRQWRSVFEGFGDRGLTREAVVGPEPIRRSIFGGKAAARVADQAEQTRKSAAVLQLISAYRRNGHLAADLDPLGLRVIREQPELSLAYWGLSKADLDTTFHTGRLAGPTSAPLRDIVARCRATYCGTVGSEFMYIRDEARRRWVEHHIEESGSRIPLTRETALRVLEKLTAADKLEQFIHTKYLGAKRFSVEGGEALIPLLDQLLSRLTQLGAKEAVIGMAHRGRLNVLANILGKAHSDIFEEFEDAFERPENLGSGDVKYHLGFAMDVETPGGRIHVNLAFNPSHLEFVAPVVVGQVRARQDHFGDETGTEAVPIIIHGDAAFSGQGIVTETLQLGGLPGYSTGGTIHIVLNNQIGFTTPPESSRSAEHCTDIVKLILPPVLHVNSDDLGAVTFVARLAAEYRQKYAKDIIIDLWCYRKYGHNEGDEPAFTNPLMVQAIKARDTPLERFHRSALELGVLTQEDIDAAGTKIRRLLDAELTRARERSSHSDELGFGGLWKGLQAGFAPSAADRPTRVPAATLKRLALRLTEVPEGFAVHRKLQRIFKRRRAMAEDDGPIDWALGEALAFATIVEDRYHIRLSGQDAARGTFSHRHAVLHDQVTGETYVQLAHLSERQGRFEAIDSPLSEAAVLGFEYGYTLVRPNSMVIWEAQFGDFANGAQVIIDQFVCSSEAKWNRCSGLVMMLPHGYEGQGPEHSSARLERFLNLSGDDNWRVMNLTTPAQLFHALRGQLHRNYRKPLILMTPKSLLRHPRAVSWAADLSEGGFQPVLDDKTMDVAVVRRVVFCSGKVYYDLEAARTKAEIADIAIVRVEQLYPFPDFTLAEVLERWETATEIVWCQEEPANMGAWSFVQPLLRELVGDRSLRYAGRARAAAPATGSKHLHLDEQAALIGEALRPSTATEAAKTA
jgi:2-oxoglutarate dehydrogenase E1 component